MFNVLPSFGNHRRSRARDRAETSGLCPEWYPPTAGMILASIGSVLFVVTGPDRPDAHGEQPYAYDIARMRSWGQRAPHPFEVCVTEPRV
jgi:hypothetical protein